jgi:hypothetical protein
MVGTQDANSADGEIVARKAQNACLELGVGAKTLEVEGAPLSADFQREGLEAREGSTKLLDAVDVVGSEGLVSCDGSIRGARILVGLARP